MTPRPNPTERRPSARTSSRSDEHVRGEGAGDELPWTAFGVPAVIVSIAFLAAGSARPGAAEGLFRVYIVTLALGFVVVRLYRAGLPARTIWDSHSPFEGSSVPRRTPTSPRAIRSLETDLRAADDPELARKRLIPWRVCRTVVDEASRRLADHHGLRLDDAAHHARIRSLVSEPTWSLIRPLEGDEGGETEAWATRRPVLLSRLDLVLEDLERL